MPLHAHPSFSKSFENPRKALQFVSNRGTVFRDIAKLGTVKNWRGNYGRFNDIDRGDGDRGGRRDRPWRTDRRDASKGLQPRGQPFAELRRRCDAECGLLRPDHGGDRDRNGDLDGDRGGGAGRDRDLRPQLLDRPKDQSRGAAHRHQSSQNGG